MKHFRTAASGLLKATGLQWTPAHEHAGNYGAIDAVIHPRIVGGMMADPNEYNFFTHVARGGILCGGSLIHEDIVLASANCKDAYEGAGEVLIGASDIVGRNGAETIGIESIFPHPDYIPGPESNDIMLVKLVSPSVMTPINLNFDTFQPVDGMPLTVIGFGLTTEDGEISETLQEAQVDVIPSATCSAQLPGRINETIHICAAVEGGDKDSCEGDTGGPLFDPETKTQYGIISFGVGCARPDVSAAYTRVSAYMDYIQSYVCETSGNPPESCPSSRPNTTAPTPALGDTPAPVAPTPALGDTPAPVNIATLAPAGMQGTPAPVLVPTAPPASAPSATKSPVSKPPPKKKNSKKAKSAESIKKSSRSSKKVLKKKTKSSTKRPKKAPRSSKSSKKVQKKDKNKDSKRPKKLSREPESSKNEGSTKKPSPESSSRWNVAVGTISTRKHE